MARQTGFGARFSIVFLLSILTGSAGAAINRTLDYGLTLEQNNNREDRAFSDFRFNINDDFEMRRFTGQYNLNSDFFVDHRDGQSNDQHRGQFDSQLHMLPSTAWWNNNARVEVLPVASATEIDEFSSQTVSTLSTGPTLSLDRQLPGRLELSLLATELRYTVTPLDASRTDVGLAWTYPLNTTSVLGLSGNLQSTEYLDAGNAGRDFDQTSLEVSYSTRTRDLGFGASVTTSKVDSATRSLNINGAEISVSYQLNALSSFVASASDSLQTSEDFNRLPGNLEEAQLEAGLLRNQRVSIGYRYNYQFFSFSADIFRNEVENVVLDQPTSNLIDGVIFRASDQFLENYRYSASYQRSESDIGNSEREEIDLSLAYVLFHTRVTTSQFVIFTDIDSNNGESSDNVGLRYLLNSRIF